MLKAFLTGQLFSSCQFLNIYLPFFWTSQKGGRVLPEPRSEKRLKQHKCIFS